MHKELKREINSLKQVNKEEEKEEAEQNFRLLTSAVVVKAQIVNDENQTKSNHMLNTLCL